MNVFQKIINKKIPANIIYEDKQFIAFYDIKPKNLGHFLVVPKEFSTNLLDITSKCLKELIIISKKLALKEIKKLNVSGFQLVINNGEESGQEIFHTHVHIIPSIK